MEKELCERPVAILYQAALPPAVNGIIKPMKPGGYSDSGADIGYNLLKAGIPLVTPDNNPDESEQTSWVFPDTDAGIQSALDKGAEVLWLNTILFQTHPVKKYLGDNIRIVGQDPDLVERYDDKWLTNALLRQKGLPIPDAVLIQSADQIDHDMADLSFPLIIKPIRGRGSAGVKLVSDRDMFDMEIDMMLRSGQFGDTIMVERYLPDQEVTLTVMPPGLYGLDGKKIEKTGHWCLPAVKRFNHVDGVAPYNGTVAVIHNSSLLSPEEKTPAIDDLMRQCEEAAKCVGARAPIRIDCRQDGAGNYLLFDLNMKPNMTGPGRPGRENQTCLSAMSAEGIGWTYRDFLVNIFWQQWKYD